MRALAVSLLCGLVAIPAWSQDTTSTPWSVNFGIKQPEDGTTMPNLRVDLDKRVMIVDENFTSVKRWRLRGRVDLTTRASENPDDSFGEAAFGLVKPWLDTSGGERLIFGIYADGRAESNQAASEWLASLQLRAIVSHLHHRGAWLLVPQVEVAAGTTWAVKSEIRESLGEASDANLRVEGEAYWTVPFRAFTRGALEPVTVSAELRGYRTNGLDAALQPLGYDQGGHVAIMAGYGFQWLGLNGIYARWSRGRLPTQPALVSSWQFGLQK